MTIGYLALAGTLFTALALPWAHGANTPLDPTKTRIANPMDQAPQIDGEINRANEIEWEQAGFRGWQFRIDQTAEGDGIKGAELSHGEKPTDDADLSADIFAGVVGEHIYIGVIVVDDDISTDSAAAGSENGQTWQDDSVEVFFDGDNSNFPDRDTTGSNPEVVDTGGQFVISANNAFRHAEAGKETEDFDPGSGWFARTKESGSGYHAEFRIPLRMIGNPQLGEHVGFTLAINDDDGGGNAESQLIWVGKTHEEVTYGNLFVGHRRYEGMRAAPPTIDGRIGADEYPGAEVVSITPFTGIYRVGDDASSPENHRFDWRLTHDEEAIYVAVQYWDDKIVADTAAANSEDDQTWVDDSVEIFFDSNESNAPDRLQDEQYDGQFVYTTNGAWRDNEANNPTYGADADWWAQSSVAENGESWQVEFVVRKATLLGGQTQDAPIGWNININDDDNGARGFQLNWNGSPHNENTYGELVLLSAKPSDPNAVADRSVHFSRIDQALARGEHTLSIRNAGAKQTLTLSDPAISGPGAHAFFIVGDFPTSVAPGETVEAIIGFDSERQTGAFEATLTYETNDPDDTEKTLTARLSASVLNLAGPIARWSLDEVEGAEMRDVSGWNRHGIYTGATLGQDPLASGSSVLFQGGSYGAVPGESLDSFVDFSVALTTNLNDLSGSQTLFAKGMRGGSPTFALLNSNGVLQWFADGEPEFETADPELVAGQTHHIVVTWDTARAAIYVDGALVAERDDPRELSFLAANPFVIGSFFGELNLDGRLDDVQFYDRTISADDVATLFATPGSELTNVEDGPGGTGQGRTLRQVGIGAGGGITFTLPDAASADIEYSIDLIHWEIISAGVSGTFEETDAGRNAAPAGYYRARP